MSIESKTGSTGLLSLDRKATGKCSAGNPHAEFYGDGDWRGLCAAPCQCPATAASRTICKSRNQLRRNMFTLIELLVVITIIAILASWTLTSICRR